MEHEAVRMERAEQARNEEVEKRKSGKERRTSGQEERTRLVDSELFPGPHNRAFGRILDANFGLVKRGGRGETK